MSKYTLEQILKAWNTVYDENMQEEYSGFIQKLKEEEKQSANKLLAIYDWQVIRKTEKGTAIDSAVATYRDAVRTAYTTRKTEITNCADTAALVTLYGSTEKDGVFTPNMTQYPVDPNRPSL